MATITKYFNLSFSQQLINEPLLYNLSGKFGVVFNISAANVTDAYGHLTLSLKADDKKLQEALDYLKARGVEIEELPAPVKA